MRNPPAMTVDGVSIMASSDDGKMTEGTALETRATGEHGTTLSQHPIDFPFGRGGGIDPSTQLHEMGAATGRGGVALWPCITMVNAALGGGNL